MGRRTLDVLYPFTISSAPTAESPITSTIKESGNFTNTIGQTKPGDRARVEGPFGRFTFVNYPTDAFLMEKVIDSLKELGVAGSRIHYERFTI